VWRSTGSEASDRRTRVHVDIALMEGGVFPPKDREKVMMLAAIRYEPVWVFYRGEETLNRLDQLRYRRIAVGSPGNGGVRFGSKADIV
jgi:TRAP-type uncharacterized transport system substrate-binding protein